MSEQSVYGASTPEQAPRTKVRTHHLLKWKSEGHKWAIANQYTVADPYLLVFYRWANRQKMPVHELKNYSALVQRVMARPAVQKVMKDEGITLES